MSATRRTSRSSRAALSLPYVRPTKKSSWSLSGFLRSLNPLRSHGSRDEDRLSSDEESDSDSQEREEQSLPSPAQSLSRRGQQLTQNISGNGSAFPLPPPPPSHKRPRSPQMQDIQKSGLPQVEFTFKASCSPSKNLDTVSNFLVQHANQPIPTEDINQMVALIQQSKPDEQPFRFESRCATSPPRSKSPNLSLPRSTSAAPRTLSKNPNGSYRWKGAGSSRTGRTRNSYSSPAITINRFRISRAATTSTDAGAPGHNRKRRKVGDSVPEQQDSQVVKGATLNPVPLPVASMSTESTSRTTMLTPLQSTPVATPVRQRTQGLQKPTAPVVPSPLRQAWTGGSPSGSESGSPQGPAPVRRTKTAQHVTDLVKSLNSQDKVLAELRNPYEVANPVKRPTMPKRKRVVAPAKRSITTAPAPKETTTKVAKEMSAHAIIEATLPEGSKRSRPPSDLEKAAAEAEEPPKDTTEEEETPPPKRFKPLTNGHKEPEGSISSAAKDTQEKPATVHSSTPTAHVPIKPIYGPKSSMPKEPSKLRFSVQPESTSTPASPAPKPKAELEAPKPPVQPIVTSNHTIPAPTEPQDKRTTPTADEVPSTTHVASPIVIPTQKSVKDCAKSQPLTALPSFTFTFPLSTSGNVKVMDAAKATPIASLPTYDLICVGVTTESLKSTSSFDWAAAGLKRPSAPSGGEWTCSECFLSNPATATTKCTTCDAPKPGAVASKPASSFDWTAAGMKQPSVPSGGEWTCGECFLANPATVTNKCTTCDAPKPGATALKPASSFDWAAAGIKQPSAPSGGAWTCGECFLSNPATATTKCTTCDAPKPGAVAPKPASSFNWGAAGLKPPLASSGGAWTCGECFLSNPATAITKCTTCDTPKPSAAAPKSNGIV